MPTSFPKGSKIQQQVEEFERQPIGAFNPRYAAQNGGLSVFCSIASSRDLTDFLQAAQVSGYETTGTAYPSYIGGVDVVFRNADFTIGVVVSMPSSVSKAAGFVIHRQQS